MIVKVIVQVQVNESSWNLLEVMASLEVEGWTEKLERGRNTVRNNTAMTTKGNIKEAI